MAEGAAAGVAARGPALPGPGNAHHPEEYFRFWSALEQEGGDRDLALDVGQVIFVETFSPDRGGAVQP